MHRGEAKERMLDIIAGQDGDRPLGRGFAATEPPQSSAPR